MNRYDAVLVGAGVMSATLAVLLHELEPSMRILIIERLESPALESSAAINNAGTGHAANCELNYTPLETNGSININKALSINDSFELSLQFWATLTSLGRINPKKFLNQIPHISFVWGEENSTFLRNRFKLLSNLSSFSDMEFTSEKDKLNEWIPIVMRGRSPTQQIAATRVKRGTDIDFGELTKAYLDSLLKDKSLELKTLTEVTNLNQDKDGIWRIQLKEHDSTYEIASNFIFLGAGGGSLTLLQKSGIPESKGYAGFPVSGQWLVCSNEELVKQHNAKVYGKTNVGSPPMSVPHLDSRWISGKKSLLFGPYAGFSTKFLKSGSYFDLASSINSGNIGAMLKVGVKNFDLIQYLLNQLMLNDNDRLNTLRTFFPEAKSKDWQLSIAGQRVQIIKKTSKGARLQMGTEVVTSTDGTLAALLGASPGASTAVKAMMEVIEKCWPEKLQSGSWGQKISEFLPNYGLKLSQHPSVIKATRQKNNSILELA